MPVLARLVDRAAVIAVLQRDVAVRLVNISRSGCLLMAPATIRLGVMGRLRVVLDGANYVGDVRVVRCEDLVGSLCKVGVEFLWISMPEDGRGDAASPALGLRQSRDDLAATAGVRKKS
jgi:PilZ domain